MLTDKQIEDIALKYTRVCGGYEAHEDAIPDRDVIDFARAIEKAVLFDELQTWTTSRWSFAANEKWDESPMKWVPLELKDVAIKAIKKESNDGV